MSESEEAKKILNRLDEILELIRQKEDEIERLRGVLQTIADLAVGHGDVCEIIARRARQVLNS